MAVKIITKNSSVAASAPLPADLDQGELAVNVVDKKIFTKNHLGSIIELGSDVESGTWTVNVTGFGIGEMTGAGTVGYYERVGRLVHCQFYTNGLGQGTAQVGATALISLPFPVYAPNVGFSMGNVEFAGLDTSIYTNSTNQIHLVAYSTSQDGAIISLRRQGTTPLALNTDMLVGKTVYYGSITYLADI